MKEAIPAELAGSALAHGAGVRSLRMRRQLTLDQLARRARLSKGHLSRFERGQKSLSVAALLRLAHALGTSVSALLGERAETDAIHIVRLGGRRFRQVPPGEGDYRYALLSRSESQGDLDIFTAELTAGTRMAGTVTHAGTESFFVLSGEVEMTIAERTVRLKAGDYLEFPGNLRHSLRSLTATATVLVVVRKC